MILRCRPLRSFALLLIGCAAASAWVESVEFPWNAFPRPLWERELVWLKNIGIRHVSLPPGQDAVGLNEAIQLVRRLGMQADVEGRDLLPASTARISALSPTAIPHTRELLNSGTQAFLWTDAVETLGPDGYQKGAVTFSGEETPATLALRRSAQLSSYWSASFSALRKVPGAGVERAAPATPVKPVSLGPSVSQFAGDGGISVVSVVNKSTRVWTGDLRVLFPSAKRSLTIPAVSVPANDAIWLPVDLPLTAGALCRDCAAFSNSDRLVYATAELTNVEYENGVLAMEFNAPVEGEVILQLTREPSGPLIAGGRPRQFDWDEHNQRLRLPIPAGKAPGNHVRLGIAIEAPDATAFFDSAKVLIIGEKNTLPAQFSSEAIAQRSRVRIAPSFPVEQKEGKEPLTLSYEVTVPEVAVNGDYADLAIEADGIQMSHVRPQLLQPAWVRFFDAIGVKMASGSTLPLFPATVSVNRRTGRDVTVVLGNNAPEIRNFHVELKAEGLDFSPGGMDTTVGASASRELSFRVFASGAVPGLHAGTVTVSGAASVSEPVKFAVFPEGGAVAFSASGISVLESSKLRATFLPGRWLEMVDRENGRNLLVPGGIPFIPGPIGVKGDALAFGESGKLMKLEDLQQLFPKAKR